MDATPKAPASNLRGSSALLFGVNPTPRQVAKTWGCLFLLGAVLAGTLVAILWWIFASHTPPELRVFDSHLSEYLNIPTARTALATFTLTDAQQDPFSIERTTVMKDRSAFGVDKSDLTGYRVGKIIPIDKIKKKITPDFYFSLPPQLRATNPDEVATILWIECEEGVGGEFEGGGGRAYVTQCDLTIIDRLSSTIVGKENFTSMPAQYKWSNNPDPHSGTPVKAMTAYVQAMPRKMTATDYAFIKVLSAKTTESVMVDSASFTCNKTSKRVSPANNHAFAILDLDYTGEGGLFLKPSDIAISDSVGNNYLPVAIDTGAKYFTFFSADCIGKAQWATRSSAPWLLLSKGDKESAFGLSLGGPSNFTLVYDVPNMKTQFTLVGGDTKSPIVFAKSH